MRPRPNLLRTLPAFLAVALVAGSCSGVSDSVDRGREPRSGADRGDAEITLEPVVDGLTRPVLVTHAGDGSGRLFVLEQLGFIRVVEDGRLLPEPYLDISSQVSTGNEQGLLGLAFHPDYEENGLLFINYTDTAGHTVIAEYLVDPANPDAADPTSARQLLTIDQPYGNHNGGGIEFGPDRYLWIGTGDGGSGGDPHGNGQRLDTLLGKLLRIDVDGGDPYSVPDDNPFTGTDDARPEIWAIGLRNPWRFSFDGEDLWIGDVGQDAMEEIDRARIDDPGLNYGWNVMEGDSCFQPPDGCDSEGKVLPIATYSHEEGCSVTGGYVYRGDDFPSLVGTYLFSDFCSGTIWGLAADGPNQQKVEVLAETEYSVSSFGVDERGELYLTDLTGTVFRVVGR